MRGSSQLGSGSRQLSSARALLCMSTLDILMQQCCIGYPKLRDYKYILACCVYF